MHDSVRGTDTTATLWRGLDYGPAVVVLAPSVRRTADVPPAWQPVEQRYQLAWCAMPAESPSLHRVEDVLETLADRNTRTHIVAHTQLAGVAADLVAEFPHIVRALVLVGSGRMPEPTGVRTRLVAAGSPASLADPEVVAEVLAAVETAETTPVRLRLPSGDRFAITKALSTARPTSAAGERP